MSREFSIDTKKTLANRINNCRKGLSEFSGSYTSVNQTLDELYKEVLQEASQMESFHEALEDIVQLYVECENRICEEGSKFINGNKSQMSVEGEDKRGFWEKLWDNIFGEDKERSYTATTEEQQQAADREMQKRLNELLSS